MHLHLHHQYLYGRLSFTVVKAWLRDVGIVVFFGIMTLKCPTVNHNPQGMRGNVQQEGATNIIANQRVSLYRRTKRNDFIGMHALRWLNLEKLLYLLLHKRHSSYSTNEEHLVNFLQPPRQ